MKFKPYSLILVATLLAACGNQVANPVTGKLERSVMSEEQEIALGRKEHQSILQEMPAYADAKLQAYVNTVGQKLARQSHRSDLQWTFTVLDSPDINAFALPGGFIYITRGLMAYMESEADLAGVIGHEIGHVTARHGAQRATRQQNAGIGVVAATILGVVLESQGVSGAGQAAGNLSQAAAAGYIASYSREQELQADGLGAEYLSRNQYDPSNMVDVIQVLKNQEQFAADQARAQGRDPGSRGGWLASHPSNDQRLAEIKALAAKYRGQANYSDDGRARYLQAIDGMQFGESEAQGMTRGRNFYHRALGIAITAPEQWSIQNLADRLVLLNSARDAALMLLTVPAQAGTSHDEIIRNVLKPTGGTTERLVVSGMQATQFTGTRANAQGQAEAVEATIINGPKDQRYILLWSGRDAGALQRARAQMRQARDSFRPLSSSESAQVRSWNLRTAPFPSGGFAELARRSPLDDAERQLRLINGYYGGGQPATGQQVKVVEAR